MQNPAITAPYKVYIETLGCQMNVNDSELMLGLLRGEGFLPTQDKHQADLVIINTCQIRGKSENKAYSYLGAWRKLKLKNPNLKIAMAGCVAQQTQEKVLDRAPFIDLVIGTQNIHELPQLVHQIFKDSTPLVACDRQKPKSTYDYFSDVTPVRQSEVSAFVTIIEGCDYFCTYCVVPYTRGRQISRKPASILEEVKQLEGSGYKEITLLGQTVDAYGKDFTDRRYGLAKLLEDIAEQSPEIRRIRFMTSHPLDLSDDIIEAIATIPNVMEFIHIPMQAGSNAVLERMRRIYTKEQYFDLIDKIKDRIPNVAISGDFIVGFPGETEAQFEESVDAVIRVGFDLANTAAYSARKQTPAGIWEDKGEGVVSEDEKNRRSKRLNDTILEVALQRNLQLHSTTQEILVEGQSRRKHFDRWRGRTRTNKVVNFTYPDPDVDLTGQLLNVKITECHSSALQGEIGVLV